MRVSSRIKFRDKPKYYKRIFSFSLLVLWLTNVVIAGLLGADR